MKPECFLLKFLPRRLNWVLILQHDGIWTRVSGSLVQPCRILVGYLINLHPGSPCASPWGDVGFWTPIKIALKLDSCRTSTHCTVPPRQQYAFSFCRHGYGGATVSRCGQYISVTVFMMGWGDWEGNIGPGTRETHATFHVVASGILSKSWHHEQDGFVCMVTQTLNWTLGLGLNLWIYKFHDTVQGFYVPCDGFWNRKWISQNNRHLCVAMAHHAKVYSGFPYTWCPCGQRLWVWGWHRGCHGNATVSGLLLWQSDVLILLGGGGHCFKAPHCDSDSDVKFAHLILQAACSFCTWLYNKPGPATLCISHTQKENQF